MTFASPSTSLNPLRQAITSAFTADETDCVEFLLRDLSLDSDTRARIQNRARDLVAAVRHQQYQQGTLEAFLHEYDLSSHEGIVLMCLAEALLRVPDTATIDRLIRDKLSKGDWDEHLGHSHSLLVNASTWGLMLTGRVVRLSPDQQHDTSGVLNRLLGRLGETVIRLALKQAIRILGEQFVMGRNIEEAMQRSIGATQRYYRHSYDMLGEAALTEHDARHYTEAYLRAIRAIATHPSSAQENIFTRPSISVKLSALHPRYEFAQRERVMVELLPRLIELVRAAKQAGIGITLDAEEADRLDLSLDLFAEAFFCHDFAGWEGLGLAVQAYQKRALPVLNWLIDLARSQGKRIPVRLVKGAYWDTEIKRAQQASLPGYPVYTRKTSTDVSYLACVKRMLAACDAFFPQFATHNAHSLAAILEIAGQRRDFEFQRLHGMGDALYHEIMQHAQFPCRVYAPVGSHEDLLPYLVRRLLENGANTSFVNRLDERIPIDVLVADPVAETEAHTVKPHPRIPLPAFLFIDRRNSAGINLADHNALALSSVEMDMAMSAQWHALPLVRGYVASGDPQPVYDPSDRRRRIGSVIAADDAAVEHAIAIAHEAAPAWNRRGAAERAAILERAADLFELHRAELMAFCVREAGKTVVDALAEVREAVDYFRYYAALARRDFATPQILPGPTGEHNELQRHGRGAFACISPWNFPLAIFSGQVGAALVAGNAVLAKPAGQTPLVAYRAVQLLHEAGVPEDILHFLPGSGALIGGTLAADHRVAGIAFTGSTATAKILQRSLAAREGAITPLIAETGGQNAMIVDSSALPEQVVKDVIRSAFNSAGQRCSALRVLFLQQEIAPKVLEMLAGAMAELRIGDPANLATDIGPVIDEAARSALTEHATRMTEHAQLLYEAPLPASIEHGCYFAPRVFEIDALSRLPGEVFGPVLHVVRYAARELDRVIDQINSTGYGLTLGVHSRLESSALYIQSRVKAGNCYVNRDVIGATVGVQPFGGEGLSGTGPKAGGPDYLLRFSVERMLSVNTAAVGGNTSLLSLREEE